LIQAAGFTDFVVLSRVDVYAGAPQHSSAAKFGTLGITFAARRLLHGEQVEGPACAIGSARSRGTAK
jgi:hypothetical protein